MMKRLFILLLTIASLQGYGQTITQYIGSKTTTVQAPGSFKVDSALYLPTVTKYNPTWAGAMRYNASDSALYVWTGWTWVKAGGGITPTLQQVLSAGATLTKNNRITLGGYGLGFYTNSTNYDSLNATEAMVRRGTADLYVADGGAMLTSETADWNYTARIAAYKNNDSARIVRAFSKNSKTYNWKNAYWQADWSTGVKMAVNVNWQLNNLDTSAKGIHVLNGAGTGTGAIQVDPEVLPEGTGQSVLWDEATKTLKRGAASGGGGASTTLSTLTYGATTTWDYSTQGTEAKVTLTGNTTLSITNLPASVTYLTLEVVQDATGSRTITLPAGTKVIGGGAGAVTLTTTGGATDILTFYWNGTTLYANIGTNYN